MSCSAAREYIALTEYRFVIRLVRRGEEWEWAEAGGEGREEDEVMTRVVMAAACEVGESGRSGKEGG